MLPTLLLILQVAAPAAGTPLAPDSRLAAADVCATPIERRDPALARVRDRMLAAIRERELDLRALMAPRIRDQTTMPVAEVLESFGPLEPGKPPGEEWLALEQALRLGGVRRGNLYVVPYIERDAPRWKEGYARLFIAGRDVPVRGTADPDGAIIARVSHAPLQEAVGVPTRAGAAGSACPDWTGRDPERMLAWVCTTDTRPVSGLYYAFSRVGSARKLTRIYSIAE